MTSIENTTNWLYSMQVANFNFYFWKLNFSERLSRTKWAFFAQGDIACIMNNSLGICTFITGNHHFLATFLHFAREGCVLAKCQNVLKNKMGWAVIRKTTIQLNSLLYSQTRFLVNFLQTYKILVPEAPHALRVYSSRALWTEFYHYYPSIPFRKKPWRRL